MTRRVKEKVRIVFWIVAYVMIVVGVAMMFSIAAAVLWGGVLITGGTLLSMLAD